MAALATTMNEYRVWYWAWRNKACYVIRVSADYETFLAKCERKHGERFIEIELLEPEEPVEEDWKANALPIGTEVILTSGAHGVVFGHYRREDGSVWLSVTHPDHWAQRRKWNDDKHWNRPPSWDSVPQSSVSVAVTTQPNA